MNLPVRGSGMSQISEAYPPVDLLSSLMTVRSGPMSYDGIAIPGSEGVAFGGQVAAQSLVAASRALESPRLPHSARCTFLSVIRPDSEVSHRLEWLKQGRAFSVLRVEAWQRDRRCLSTIISFQTDENSPQHQMAMPMLNGPDDWPTSHFIPPGTNPEARRCFDIREVDPFAAGLNREYPQQVYWVRSKTTLGTSADNHFAAVLWFSDLSMPWTSDLPYSEADGERVGASLDHAVWFHRPFRADDWLLFVQESVVYFGARALTRGSFFSRDGALVASAIQETLLRRIQSWPISHPPQVVE